MEIYLAVCNETNNVKLFTIFSDLKKFAKENRYEYSYLKIDGTEEFYDYDLFLYE